MQGLHLDSGANSIRGTLTLRKASCDDEALSGVPLFRSMEAALSFAFSWRALLGVKVGEIKEYTGKEGGMMLSTNEKKAQARFVLDVIASHLSLDQQAVLDASYGGEQGERCAAIDRLTCLFESANRNRTLVRMTLMREFVYGERYCPSQVQLARECGVNQATVSRIAAKIAPEVALLRESAIEKLTPAFARRGWIPKDI
jgi:hypothetical protein